MVIETLHQVIHKTHQQWFSLRAHNLIVRVCGGGEKERIEEGGKYKMADGHVVQWIRGSLSGWLSALGYPCFLTIRITVRIRHSIARTHTQLTNTIIHFVLGYNVRISDSAFG